MTMAAPSRPEGLLEDLAGIISAARRRAGLPAMSDAHLEAEVSDWKRILEPIPPARIRDAELRAVRSRTLKALLQPAELLAAWTEIRAEEVARPLVPIVEALDRVCYYCEGTGWQIVVKLSESGAENTEARGCYCFKAPLAFKHSHPLRHPDWRKRIDGVWERVT